MVAFWQFGLLGVLVVALATDLKSRKIYNWLTFPAIATGLLLQFATGGLAGVQSGLLGLVAGSAVFLVGFLVNAMGAGDVKLMAAVGAWLGWPSVMSAVLYVALIGGVVAVVAAALNGTLAQLFKNVRWFMVGLVVPGAKPEVTIAESAAPPVPYGVSIALGTALALVVPDVGLLASRLGG